MWVSARFAILISLGMISPMQADNIHLYAAGSLKDALTAMAKSYEAESGDKVEAKYGPSGLLKDEILSGANAHVFASANMQHPEDLRHQKRSGPVVRWHLDPEG
jgi:ABC-type molybdate transport system substrate-binding protein